MVIALFFASSSAFAQKFEIGAKGGINISNFTGTSWQDASSKSLVGFHVGGFISFFLGDNFAIQPEVLFSTQGAKVTDSAFSSNVKVSYINIPVMLKYRFNGGFYVEAGPQIGFKSSESNNGETISNFAKSTDLSLAAGIGYHSKIGLGIGARYTAGLSKVGDFSASDGINPDFKNGVIQISIFYTLFNNRK